MATTLMATTTSIDTRIITLGWSSDCARSRVRFASKVQASHQASSWCTTTAAHHPVSPRAMPLMGTGISAAVTAQPATAP